MLRAAVFLFLCPGALGGKAKCSDVRNVYKDGSCCGKAGHEISTDSLCGGNTLDEIYERGFLICGVKDSQPGMGYFDPDANDGKGGYTGLDISYCEAINAALNLTEPIRYVVASAGNRFEKLADKEIDVLIRTTTWTTERDAEKGADFAGINFYDGQSILVNKAKFPTEETDQLGGARVCVQAGTTSEGNLDDFFANGGMALEKHVVTSDSDGDAAFKDGECDAITGDMSAMVAKKYMFENLPADEALNFTMWIGKDQFSKEPLAAATRDGDTDLNEIVSWVWYGMITAEEMNISSTNYKDVHEDACKEGGAPAKCRLLTENLGLGTVAHPLPATWMQNVLETVGNYAEAYNNAFCDESGCHIERSGHNNLVRDGGLQFAPPMRR